MKPIIFVSPLTLSLKKLREDMGKITTEENIEIYDIENIDEANQTIASIGPSVVLISNSEKCNQILKKNRKQLISFKSKILLVTQASLPPLELEKMRKSGLSDNIYEPINQKTLLHKVKMLIKALPQPKSAEEEEEAVKTFSANKEDSSFNTNEKLRMEKGVASEDGIELDSDNIEDEKSLLSLDDYRKKKKEAVTLDLDTSEEDKRQSETTLDIQKNEKKSRLGSLLKSLGSFGKKKIEDPSLSLDNESKKKNSVSLDIDGDTNHSGNETSGFEIDPNSKKASSSSFNIEAELKRKKLEASLSLQSDDKAKKDQISDLAFEKKSKSLKTQILLPEEEAKRPITEITIEDIKRMKKQGISLDVSPNTPKDHLENILKRDPVLRKKILNFKMAEEAKKNKKAGITTLDLEKNKPKKQTQLDIMKVRSGVKETSGSIREKLLEEKRLLLQKKMQEEAMLREFETEEETKKKEEVVVVYEPNSKSMEKIIEMLTIYQDKKMDRLEVFKRCAQTIFDFKNGLTCFLSYNADKKEFEDLFISHTQEFNTDKNNRGEEQWKQLRSERIKKWAETKTAKWSDEWFSGNARDAEFISPVIEGKNILGVVVVHFMFKENQNLNEQDSRKIEVFVESTRGVYLERFKGNKDKAGDKEEELAGDGTSYSKIFKDFMEKIFKKAA